MKRLTNWAKKRPLLTGFLAVVVVALLGVGWWLGSPLFINKTVNEELPAAQASGQSESSAGTAGNARAQKKRVGDNEPKRLYGGKIVGVEHEGTGEANFYEVDGKTVLRLENLDVTNGPDLQVYVSKERFDSTDAGEFVDLGDLKGNRGNQNYEVPSDLDPSEYDSVMIWCKSFAVAFAGAPIEKA